MIKILIEDRDPKKSVPSDLENLFKHVLNCIYEPKLFHKGWVGSVSKHSTSLQNDAENFGYKKIYRICESCLDKSYNSGYNMFFRELNNGHNFKNNPYTEKEMRRIIPKTVDDIGKNTIYENYTWTIDNILDKEFINNFIEQVKNNSESAFDLYK